MFVAFLYYFATLKIEINCGKNIVIKVKFLRRVINVP